VKFGIAFANTGAAATPDGAIELAHTAEEAGFESLWTVEHVVVPAGYESQYPYSPDGRMPGGEDAPIPDPLIWLTWAAAASRTLRLATGIVILPQRNPVVLAKEVATLDVLSSGRALLGIGVGWLKEEFDAIGVPFEERAARTDEYVEALRVLWRDPEPTFHGRFAHFERAQSYPKPVQPGGVPIVVGGHSPAAARRAGRLGDGFFPAQGRLDVLPGLLGAMRSAAQDAGRDPDAIEVTTGTSVRADVDMVRRYEDLGIERLVIPNAGPERLRVFADEVITPLG
jgi:probable F420-dependent oxidoreductase